MTATMSIQDNRAMRFIRLNHFVVTCTRVLMIWAIMALVSYFLMAPGINRPLYDFILFPVIPFVGNHYDHQVWYNTVRRQEYFIRVENRAKAPLLNAWYFQLPHAKHVVLMHHGQGGNLTNYEFFAEVFMKLGCSVVVYDYEGYGHSTGHPSVPGLVKDGDAVYRWLINEKHIKPQQIVHVGISLGTGVASTVGQKYPCAGIILLSPYDSLMRVGHHLIKYLDYYPDFLIGYPDLGSITPLSKAHPPVLMLHGRQDHVIPIEYAEEIADAADKRDFKYVRFEHSGHTDFFNHEPQKFLCTLNDFLISLPNNSASH